MPDGTASSHLLKPKLATVLGEGYVRDDFRRDVIAGLTVAIVALPLSMAIAVASGVSPDRGLYTAIVGGFLVSLLGGSRYQIGGPAGAFIVLVSATVANFGNNGLVLTVLVSGLFLVMVSLFRLGSLIRHIPHAVTVGFTCAIAVTILASQLKDFAGLHVVGPEPGQIIPKIAALLQARASFNISAFGVGLATTILIFGLKKLKPIWPTMLIALTIVSLVCFVFHLPIETIGGRFGGIPHTLPSPKLPAMSWMQIWQILPAAVSFTLLGGVESLLSAKVADGMTKRKHRPNMELLAQGMANIASAVFGGICVTGTIARTATNIRAGARSPVSGMLHAIFLLLFMFVAAPLASYIPLAALAGVLVTVCWNMFEKEEFFKMLLDWRLASVMLATFGLTLLKDLTFGIVAGCVIAAFFTMMKKTIPEEGE